MAKIVLRHNQLAKLRRLKGGMETDQAFAQRIGVHHAQVSRVLSGKSKPGERFIAGVLDVFGIDCFSDLFALLPDDNGNGDA